MKKFLVVLGSIFGVLILVGVIGFSILAYKGTNLDNESKQYVDQVAPIILANLNKQTLFEYADDQLINSASPEEFDKIFKWFEKLGSYKEYVESTGQANISYNFGSGNTITAYYEAKVEFENGPATARITIIKREELWKIIGFHVNSMTLADPTNLIEQEASNSLKHDARAR